MAALAGWVALVAVAYWWGHTLNSHSRAMLLDAPPLFGHWHLRLGPGALPGTIIAGTVVLAGPALAVRLAWRRLLLVVPAAATVFAVALSWVDGPRALLTSVVSDKEYLVAVSTVHSPGAYLHQYVALLPNAPIQVQAHPPAMVLLLWALRQVHLAGPWWVAGLIILVGSSTGAAALIALREVAGEHAARTAAPFLVLLPAAIWVATSADALFAGVGAWAVALLIVATTRPGSDGDRLAFVAGLLGGLTLFLTYGALLLACVPLVVIVARRQFRPVLVAAVGAATVAVVFALGGFWWLDGLHATLHQYQISVTRDRPPHYFALANLAAFALALGPSVVVGTARLRDRRAWMLVGGGLLAIALADLSGLSKGEVERIWLLFVPWVAIGACTLADTDGQAIRGWLALQAIAALGLQLLLRTPW